MKPLLLTTKQVCDMLGVSASTLRCMVFLRGFPAPVDLGICKNLYRRKDVERWAKKLNKKRGR